MVKQMCSLGSKYRDRSTCALVTNGIYYPEVPQCL